VEFWYSGENEDVKNAVLNVLFNYMHSYLIDEVLDVEEADINEPIESSIDFIFTENPIHEGELDDNYIHRLLSDPILKRNQVTAIQLYALLVLKFAKELNDQGVFRFFQKTVLNVAITMHG